MEWQLNEYLSLKVHVSPLLYKRESKISLAITACPHQRGPSILNIQNNSIYLIFSICTPPSLYIHRILYICLLLSRSIRSLSLQNPLFPPYQYLSLLLCITNNSNNNSTQHILNYNWEQMSIISM